MLRAVLVLVALLLLYLASYALVWCRRVQYRKCMVCGGTSVFRGMHRPDSDTHFLAYHCSHCGQDFVVHDGRLQKREDGPWMDAEIWGSLTEKDRHIVKTKARGREGSDQAR